MPFTLLFSPETPNNAQWLHCRLRNTQGSQEEVSQHKKIIEGNQVPLTQCLVFFKGRPHFIVQVHSQIRSNTTNHSSCEGIRPVEKKI